MEHFQHVFAAVGSLDAVCCCEPPGARGGSDLPWYYSLLNLLGIVKARRAEAEVFLGLRQGNLVYVAFDSDGAEVAKAIIPLTKISAGQVGARGEWGHSVAFVVDGAPFSYQTCGYLFGASTPLEYQGHLQQMERAIVTAIAHSTLRT